jgi:hypothetical protein
MRFRTLVLVSAAALAVSGCAAPIIGALTLGQLSTIAGGISTLTTGKGLADHALSLLTGKDCSIAEGILRKDRKVCEVRGSLATKDDFKGVFAYFEKKKNENEKAAPGDQVLASYARARGEELAQDGQENVKEVTPATASALDLRLLPFADDDANGAGGGAPAKVVMAANTTPVAAPADSMESHMKLLTYRDTDIDGTPRIVSRYVYTMSPIPDAAPGTVATPAVMATAAPVAAPSVAQAPSIAAAPPPSSSAPVVVASQAQAPPAPSKPAPLMAPAPTTAPVATKPAPAIVPASSAPVAPAKPVVAQAAPAVTPTHYQPATSRKVADGPPTPIVYWYLSGR